MKWKRYEEKWRKAWSDDKVFVPDLDDTKKKFFITVPYPYTSGPLHIGHGRTFTIGDIIARYKRHRGYNVLFPMAFHISGSPILSISDRISHEDAPTINLYTKYLQIYESRERARELVEEEFKDPEKVANYFASKISADFESIGYSIDWTRQFNTGEPLYNRFVEWQFQKLREEGVLVKGSHPILWSLEEDQPVGEDDIKDGDTDRVTIEQFTAVKFPFEGGYIVAATLRPETLFGATNIWVNPKGIYAKAKVDGETWIISREGAEKLKVQGRDVKTVKTLRGRELVARTAENPITGDELPVLPASFVDLDEATGVVYSVPGHAPYDYQAVKDLQRRKQHREAGEIFPIVIIDVPGREVPAEEVVEAKEIKDQTDPLLEEATQEVYKEEFYTGLLNSKCGDFEGMRVEEAKGKVREKLLKGGEAFVFYETNRKSETRAKNKVVVGVIDDQWFIDYSDEGWKAKTREWLKKMLIIPEKFRKLFQDTVDWLDKRPCARRHGLGTRFPFDKEWVIESLSDSTIYMAFYTVVAKLRQVKGAAEKATPEVFDFLFLGQGDAGKVAKSSGIPKGVLLEAREEFEYWYPNDLRHTAPAHISNHLTFFVMHHIRIFDEPDWPRSITLNELLIREGKKMSKSKGNVIPLANVADKYGSDLYRLYVASSADFEAVVDWREREVHAASNKLTRFIGIIDDCLKAEEGEEGPADRWFLSRFNMALKKATESMDKFDFRDAVIEILFKILNDFKWLEKRSKNPFWTVRRIAKNWLIAMAPVVPHTAEEYWEKLGEEGFASLAEWPEPGDVDRDILRAENFLIRVVEQVRSIAQMVDKKPEKVYLYTADDWKYRALECVLEDKERSMKHVSSFENREEAAEVLKKLIKQRIWEQFSQKVDEASLLEEAKSTLEEELGAEIRVNPKEDPMNKQKKAMPFGPAIYIA